MPDERIPCSACVRRNTECSFLVPIPDGSSDNASDPALPSNDADWLLDLKLMHHYPTVVNDLGARDEVVNLWRYDILQQALEHSFLMHGLLAFAALHLDYLRVDSSLKYLTLCDKHQTIALERFRTILSSPIDPELIDALFALSATLSISSMARSCALSDTATLSMDAIAEHFVLTKGVADVIHLAYGRLRQSCLAVMLEGQSYPQHVEVRLPQSIILRFEAVRDMLMVYGLDSEALENCRSALTELETIYKNIAYFSPRTNIEIGMVNQWEVKVPVGYVRLIRACNPPALVILAYYTAAVTAVRTAWYTQNWAEYGLRGIHKALVLEENLSQFIQWPMQQVQDRMSDLGVRSPNE